MTIPPVPPPPWSKANIITEVQITEYERISTGTDHNVGSIAESMRAIILK